MTKRKKQDNSQFVLSQEDGDPLLQEDGDFLKVEHGDPMLQEDDDFIEVEN